MLNICMIVPGMPSSEEEWFLPYLTEYMRALSNVARLHVYAIKYPGTGNVYNIHGIQVTAFRPGGLGLQRRLMNAITANHEQSPYTHIHTVWANTAGFFGTMVANRLAIPLIVTMGGEELVSLPAIKYGAMLKWRTRPALRYAFHHASVLIAASGITLQRLRLQWKVPETKLRQLWFGADEKRFQELKQPHRGEFHIVTSGGLIPVKRHHLLLSAFAIVRERIPNARLTIAGEGPLRASLEDQARKLGIHSAVHFPGWIHHDDMPALYAGAGAVAVTSYSEEIPMAIVEALASGVPVVATNVGIAYDLHETGAYPVFLAEPSAESFAAELMAVYERMLHNSIQPVEGAYREKLYVGYSVAEMMKIFEETKR